MSEGTCRGCGADSRRCECAEVSKLRAEVLRLHAALADLLVEVDYWSTPPRPAVHGGTVRLWRFDEVQPSTDRSCDRARAALAGETDLGEPEKEVE